MTRILTEEQDRDSLAREIGDAMEQAMGHDWMDNVTPYGAALMVLEYLDTGTCTWDHA